jgi:phosphate starvation-inducible protein PhoH and related proteins
MTSKKHRMEQAENTARSKNNSMTVRIDDLRTFEPITKNQEIAFQAWDEGDNLVLAGSAGTGKTFIAMYLALEEVLDPSFPQDKIVLIRSMVPTRDVGFLPGTLEEKQEAYISLYRSMCSELFGDSVSYNKMISAKQLQFESTSYIRGSTFNNAIIIVDEMQNLNFHELDSVITRVGKNSKIIFSGDYYQSDFRFKDEKEGIFKFLSIIEQLKGFTIVNYGWDDIVRSGLVRDYIMTKEMLGISND